MEHSPPKIRNIQSEGNLRRTMAPSVIRMGEMEGALKKTDCA